VEKSKAHGMEMFQAGDEPHLSVMKKMKEQMPSSEAMKEWFDEKRRAFDSAPEA